VTQQGMYRYPVPVGRIAHLLSGTSLDTAENFGTSCYQQGQNCFNK